MPGSAGNVVAAVLSFFIPGLGQLCQGRIGMAFLWVVIAAAVWVVTLGFLGWVVHIFAAYEAATWVRR